MNHPASALRVCLGCALVLAAVASIAPVEGARAQGAQASITLYKAVCPEGYIGTDYFNDCYDNPGNGFTFSLTGPGYTGGDQTTSGSGFAAFEGISAGGTYTLTELFPANIVDFVVACSAGGSPFPFTYVTDGIELDLTTSDDLRCDWFNIPVGPANNDQASVTIYKAECPPEYAGDAFYEDCYDRPGSGYTFTLSGPGFDGSSTTDASGVAFFDGIVEGGVFALTEEVPVPVEGFVVVCTEDGESFPFTYAEGGIELTLDVNDDLRCDWFNIPADNGLASITIYKAVCPPGYDGDAFFDDCFDTPGVGIAFTLTGPVESVDATTGNDGFAVFADIDTAGTYTVEEDVPADVEEIAIFCSEAGTPVEVTAVENGISLDLALDDDIRCDWYDIPEAGAPTPQPTASGGVSTLPSTGTGTAGSSSNFVALTLVLALAAVALGWRLAPRAVGGRRNMR